ncbi:MAG: hypothetical protein AAF921_05160 [Cyanobacteria bacterium P01_D01_bin.44]
MLSHAKKTLSNFKIKRLLALILLIGLVADFIPHPALGPSLLVQTLTSIAEPVRAAPHNAWDK